MRATPEILNEAGKPSTPVSAAALLDAAKQGAAPGELCRLAAGLALPGPGRAEALAHWINLFNALVLHAARHFGVRDSLKEIAGFFRRAAYRVNGFVLALDDLEHGILRANRGHPRRVFVPQFAPWDPRRRLVVRPMDLRIHFALNCGAASCPPIRHYEADRIDEQLDLAARAFLDGGGVAVADDGRLEMSRLLLWYARDFGWTARARLRRVLAWIDAGREDELLAAARRGIRHAEYDWSYAHG